MKDFEAEEEEEEEKIRVEVGFFAHFFIRESLSLVSSRDVYIFTRSFCPQNAFLNWIFHLSSSLFREEHSMRLTRLSLFTTLSLETDDSTANSARG